MWGFYDADDDLYGENNPFVDDLASALTRLMEGGRTGAALIKGLANSSNVVQIMSTDRSKADSHNRVGWNSTGVGESVATTAGLRSDPMITLGHELAHIEGNWKEIVFTTWFNLWGPDKNGKPVKKPVSTSEIYATHIENQLRSENKLPLRTHYGISEDGFGLGPRIITHSGASRYIDASGYTNYRPLGKEVEPYLYGL